MKSMQISNVTPGEAVRLTEVPIPIVKPGWVLVKVKGFGMNHSEQILRYEEIKAPYIQKPVTPASSAWAKLPILLTADGNKVRK